MPESIAESAALNLLLRILPGGLHGDTLSRGRRSTNCYDVTTQRTYTNRLSFPFLAMVFLEVAESSSLSFSRRSSTSLSCSNDSGQGGSWQGGGGQGGCGQGGSGLYRGEVGGGADMWKGHSDCFVSLMCTSSCTQFSSEITLQLLQEEGSGMWVREGGHNVVIVHEI